MATISYRKLDAIGIHSPVEYSVGDSIGIGLDPVRILQHGTTGSVLLEVFVGDLSSEDILSIILVGGEGGKATGSLSDLTTGNSFDNCG
jgi:hypothetical protein